MAIATSKWKPTFAAVKLLESLPPCDFSSLFGYVFFSPRRRHCCFENNNHCGGRILEHNILWKNMHVHQRKYTNIKRLKDQTHSASAIEYLQCSHAYTSTTTSKQANTRTENSGMHFLCGVVWKNCWGRQCSATTLRREKLCCAQPPVLQNKAVSKRDLLRIRKCHQIYYTLFPTNKTIQSIT